jgi:pyruvate,orthophosphate dikinase
MTQSIFDFDHEHQVAPMDLKDLLGGKGANLAEMISVLGLPVPPGFTISTPACQEWLAVGMPETLVGELASARHRLEQATEKCLGDPDDPLLVSVRSGAKFSMPGMMDTVLNLGLNDRSVLGLARQTSDQRFAFDSYRRFISMYAKIVLGVDGALFDNAFEAAKESCGAQSDASIPTALLAQLAESYKALVRRATGRAFPQDPGDQLLGAITAVFASWAGPRAIAYREREGIAHDLGTAVNVQAMVFGNRDDNSGTGVGFTRDPATGAKGAYGDFLVNAQGEDVVAGIRITEPLSTMREQFPEAHGQLLGIFERLERHYRDMCDTEFTIEQGRLWMLQTRVGKRTGRAAIRMAVEMTSPEDLQISREEAIQRVGEHHLDQVLHPQFASPHDLAIGFGLGASPGAAVGRCYFNADDVVVAGQRGEKTLLVRPETSPEDVHGMLAAEGVLTSRGGLVSHAAVIARGWGKPAVVGVERLAVFEHHAMLEGRRIDEGQWLSIDGATGEIMLGVVPLVPSETSEELTTLLGWADDVRQGHLGIRANADTGDDAAIARLLGAEGIGLCRTEHMFLGEDRLPIVRRMILATDSDEARLALAELQAVQREDFDSILEAMDGLPVTVRLLDPPLHEFLPSIQELVVKDASGGLSPVERDLLTAAQSWQETNPMLGTRGVRLGVVRPGLYEAQVRALMEAVVGRLALGGAPIVEIMIPLTVSLAELENAHRWIDEAIESSVAKNMRYRVKVKIGTMIETPRAALIADQLATCAEFFSFGTNDLTQMTFGFSRDDVEGRLMDLYLEQGLLSHNPFEAIDEEGVGALMRIGIELGRKANPLLTFGVCGEHGGNPVSIALFFEMGVDYVSCSPYRVPVARLAAAQAAINRR